MATKVKPDVHFGRHCTTLHSDRPWQKEHFGIGGISLIICFKETRRGSIKTSHQCFVIEKE